MNLKFALKQVSSLVTVAAEHTVNDPVFFLMQISRRLPNNPVNAMGRGLCTMKSPVLKAAGQWLTGAHKQMYDTLAEASLKGRQAAAMGELALHSGNVQLAQKLAEKAREGRRKQELLARIEFFQGHMSRAIEQAPAGLLKKRLTAERKLFTGIRYSTPQKSFPHFEVPQLDIAFLLNNSLPHTQSGYTLRSHAVLEQLNYRGLRAGAVTRLGYPLVVGKPSGAETEIIGPVPYTRSIPWALSRMPDERVLQQADYFTEYARLSRAKVLHTTTHFVNGMAARIAAKRLDLPWVYEVRGILEETWAASRPVPAAARLTERYRLFAEREAEVANSADAVITLGEQMRRHLISQGVEESKITVIPNGVSHALLSSGQDVSAAQQRQHMGLPSGGFWVGCAASIVEYEGLDILVGAVKEARIKGQDIRLLIVGDGTALPALKEQARKLGENAVFTGRVPQAQAHNYVRCLDAYVVPRIDSEVTRMVTPLKPVEAAALGRPVVMSQLPALLETLPAEAREVFPAGNSPALTGVLFRLKADPQLRSQIAAAGSQFVRAERTWEALSERFTDLVQVVSESEGGVEAVRG